MCVETQRSNPTVHAPLTPLLAIPAVNSVWIDLPTDSLPALMRNLYGTEVQAYALTFLPRGTSRSPGSTPEIRRSLVEVLMPSDASEANVVLAIRFLRRTVMTSS
eukprot:1356236-Pyramimonas_sp.AAC.1